MFCYQLNNIAELNITVKTNSSNIFSNDIRVNVLIINYNLYLLSTICYTKILGHGTLFFAFVKYMINHNVKIRQTYNIWTSLCVCNFL